MEKEVVVKKRKVYTKAEQMERTLSALRDGCSLTVFAREHWTCVLAGPDGNAPTRKRTEKRSVRKYVFEQLKRDGLIEGFASQPNIFGEGDKIYRLKVKIESDAQRAVTANALETFRNAAFDLAVNEDENAHPLLRQAQINGIQSMIEEFEQDLRDYDARKVQS